MIGAGSFDLTSHKALDEKLLCAGSWRVKTGRADEFIAA